jgi:hypothetical protein
MLLGLAAAALPAVIHLIGRRYAERRRFAAFDFLLAVNKRIAKRERLRQLLLLTLRTLALAALVLAVSRPLPPARAALTGPRRTVAVVLDASHSMSYLHDGRSLMDRAVSLADQRIADLDAGTPAARTIVQGGDIDDSNGFPTLDHGLLRTRLRGLAPAGAASLGRAMARAVQNSGDNAMRLCVVTDLARSSFTDLGPLPGNVQIELLDAAEREQPLTNASIVDLRVLPSPTDPLERILEVDVVDRTQASDGQPLVVVIDGQQTHRGYVDLRAGEVATKRFTHRFETPGTYAAAVRLQREGDGYAWDDAYSAAIHVPHPVSVLLVNGDPRSRMYEDELFFARPALEAIPKSDPPIHLSVVTEADLQRSSLVGQDVAALCNTGNLDDSQTQALRDFRAGGGALFFALGNRLDFEWANRSIADLLPTLLRDRHGAEDHDAGTPAVSLGEMAWDHPILRSVGETGADSLRASRTSHYFNVQSTPGAQVLLRFDNGAPALVVADKRMALLTSIDIDDSDLILRSAFPPLLQAAIRFLAGHLAATTQSSVRIGEPLALHAVNEISVTTPSGQRTVHGPGDVLLTPTEVGLHRFERHAGDTWESAPDMSVAVWPSLGEADFTPVDAAWVAQAATAAEVAGRGKTRGETALEKRGAASYLLAALCILFIGESALARRG